MKPCFRQESGEAKEGGFTADGIVLLIFCPYYTVNFVETAQKNVYIFPCQVIFYKGVFCLLRQFKILHCTSWKNDVKTGKIKKI